MITTLVYVILSAFCLLWYCFVISITAIFSRKRILCFNLLVSCIRDICEIWDCNIEDVQFRLNQIKKR